MKTFLYVMAVAGIAVFAQGCAEMQWVKPGADAATLARDQDQCRAQALGRAAPPVAGRGSADARTDGVRPPVMSTGQGSNERFIAENEEVRRCMLQRGYELKPTS